MKPGSGSAGTGGAGRARPGTGAQAAPPLVEGWVDRLGGFIERHRGLALRLGDLETRLLGDRLDGIDIREPVYVTGLARSGSTILLELLARHPDLASHRYRDFPPVFTPVAWNWFVDRAARGPGTPRERAHGDGIVVTPESPEAFEEVIWMAFFPGLHDPGRDAVMDSGTSNPAFETFYRDHVRKLIMVRGAARYLAKANYDVTRLGYLLKLFPDARFVVPVRGPAAHVASLMRQHARFCREGRRDPRVPRHMARAGHFEFGLDRRPPSFGDGGEAALIAGLWRDGQDMEDREIEGWARLWRMVYGHVVGLIAADPAIAGATLVVRHEDLCTDPSGVMSQVLDHCRLTDGGLSEAARTTVHAPGGAGSGLSVAAEALVAGITADVAPAFGYVADAPARPSRAGASSVR